MNHDSCFGVRGPPKILLPWVPILSDRSLLGACKIRRGGNVIQDRIQNYTSGSTKAGEPSPPWRTKIVMACFRTTPRDESQTVSNNPLRCSNATLKPTYLTILFFTFWTYTMWGNYYNHEKFRLWSFDRFVRFQVTRIHLCCFNGGALLYVCFSVSMYVREHDSV